MSSILKDPRFVEGLQETMEEVAIKPTHLIIIAVEEDEPGLVTISMSRMAADSEMLRASSVRDALVEAIKILDDKQAAAAGPAIGTVN